MSPQQPPGPRLALDACLVGVGAALQAAVLAGPGLLGLSPVGDALTRWTVRLALVYYALAAALMLRLRRPEWATRGRGRAARWLWTLACAAYLVHVGVAFHFAHGWSHQRAYDHTQAVSGFGPGVFVSYLFTLVWLADVVWWWARPSAYAYRPNRLGWLLHGFMAFVIFNATVVFEDGAVRWAGVLLFAGLTFLFLLRGPPGRPWRGDGPAVADGPGSAISPGW
jgi:hypothetical protein